jgi:hypothetical protein
MGLIHVELLKESGIPLDSKWTSLWMLCSSILLLELVDLHVTMGYGSSSCDDCYGLYLLSWDGNGSLRS